MGDSSDNIPGVAGIGQKTAGDLISRFGSIDYIYRHIDEIDIKKGVREKLIADKENAYLSRTLGTINLEAPVDVDMDSYIIGTGDTGKAIRLLSQLEMFGIIEKLGLTAPDAGSRPVRALHLPPPERRCPRRVERRQKSLGREITASKKRAVWLSFSPFPPVFGAPDGWIWCAFWPFFFLVRPNCAINPAKKRRQNSCHTMMSTR